LRRILCFIVVLASALCQPLAARDNEVPIAIDKLVQKVSKRLEKRHQLTLSNYASRRPDERLDEMVLQFEIRGPLPRQQLRIILVDCANELVHEVNRNEALKPHLASDPFTPNNVHITLWVKDLVGNEPPPPPNVGIAKFQEGEVSFSIIDYTRGMPVVVTELSRESFEIAAQIVEQNIL
jgi:hypothetical protein